MNVLNRNRKHVIIFFISLFLLLLVSVVFFYTTSSHIPYTHAQESGSISPTPSPIGLASPSIPDINPESLRDPDAFKLDQQIKQATRELFQSTDSVIRESTAVQRKNLMKQAIKKYPYVFLGNALTSSQIASLDAQLQQYFEKSLILSNVELGVTHVDDFENHTNSRFDYSLQNLTDHTRFNFYPSGEFDGHISGTTLNVNGVALDDDITARVFATPQGGGGENNDLVQTNVEILKEASPDALGPQRVAVILLKEKQVQNPYSSKEQIEEMIFRGDVQKFFKEASYGKMWLDEEKSKVYGWYEMEHVFISSDTAEDLRNEVIKLTDPDIDFTQFDRVMIGVSKLFTSDDGSGRTTTDTSGGWGYVGNRTYLTSDGTVYLTFSTFGIGSNSSDTYVHESGHNFGLWHANRLDCIESSIKSYKDNPYSRFIDGCLHIEYGNSFDVMGTGNLGHFNGYFKEVLGWINSNNKSIVNINQHGIYTVKLQPLETDSVVIAKITRENVSNFHPFYLEYRTRSPFGSGEDNSGILINKIYEPSTSWLLDASPSDYSNYFLQQGKTFMNEKSGVKITAIAKDTVNVEMEEPSCKSNDFNTEIEGIYAYPFIIYNDNDYSFGFEEADLTCQDYQCTLKRKKQEPLVFAFGLKIRNNNSYACPDVRVQAFIDQSPWEKDPKLAIVEHSIASSEYYQYFMPFVIIPASAPTGSYNIGVKAENVDANSSIFINGRILQIIDEIQTFEGDLNNDQKVDIFDLVTVAKDFGKKGEGFAGDADKNGVVDIFDLVIVAKNFGKKL